MSGAFKHCDDYIDDPAQPECLRAFLSHARAPAHGCDLPTPRPPLFADYGAVRVRVVMASRFGDVGITHKLHAEHGYDLRVAVADLTNFGTRRKGDSDRSGEAGETRSGSTVGESADPKGIAQTSPGEHP